jgi:hypothetical protein
MSDPERTIRWTEANQRLLVAEFARLKQRLGADGDPESLRAACDAARADMTEPAAIDCLADSFGLSAFERDVLLLCAGVEMDAQFAERCEIATGESRRPRPTFGLALSALESAHWSALAPVRPLRRWRLLELDESLGLCRGGLRIDERVLHYLAGANYLDVRLRSLMRQAVAQTTLAESHRALSETILQAASRGMSAAAPVIWLSGNDPLGQLDVAVEVAAALGLGLHVLHPQDIPTAAVEVDALTTLWERETILLGGALLIDGGTDPLPPAVIRFVELLRSLVFVSAGQPRSLARTTLRFAVDKPDAVEQRQLWQQALGESAGAIDETLDGIATQFKLSARTIQVEGARLAPELALSARPDRILWSACRSVGRVRLDELAQRIESVSGWEDLILPQAQRSTLREICAHVRNRLKVHLEWGFADRGARGLGVSALFTGESGTGKTLAAEVLARELQLDLYRIDLSAVVSKYIGETEKNLCRVFDAAEDSGAVLLFDEADALFGKRSEVKDSHDRYANIEVSYLLQRMETYRGLAILTTNLKHALDVAFERRLRFVVHFSFPDHHEREAIWRGAFPARTPCRGVDYAKLARLGVTGGSIRNIAIDAAFRAAELKEPVTMAHLLHAAHHDAAKRGRSLSEAETRGWA